MIKAKFFFLFLALTNFLLVTNISCKTQYGACEEEDLKLTKRFLGQNIFLVSPSAVQETLMQNAKNQKVYLSRVFPHTLSVFINKRKAVVAVNKENFRSGVFLIGQDGTVLYFENFSALPTITLGEEYPNPFVSEVLGQEVVEGGKLILLVSRNNKVLQSRIENGEIRARVVQGANIVEVIFPLKKDISISAGALQLILAQAKMENKIPQSIDLRYKNPVLKY